MATKPAQKPNALQSALERVQKHANTAAILTPLALAALPGAAHAIAVTGPTPLAGISITTTLSTNASTPGVTYFTYGVTDNDTSQNTSGGYFPYEYYETYTSLDSFEIPELHAGDLTAYSLAEGWSATETTMSSQSGTGVKDGTVPGAYILVSTTSGNGVSSEGEGFATNFTFTSTLPSTTSANFGGTVDLTTQSYFFLEGYSTNSAQYETGYVDPLIPAGTAVPEPASMLILGGAALATAGFRTRRKG